MIHMTHTHRKSTTTDSTSKQNVTSLKRRITKSRSSPKSMTRITLTQALFVLLVVIWTDDSAPPFFVSPQPSPQSAPILVTPTPQSRPTTTAPFIQPTAVPVPAPTRRPTGRPVTSTEAPITDSPTTEPTIPPTPKPVIIASASPSAKPSIVPSSRPSELPSLSPKPTSVTMNPTISPPPSVSPTFAPISRAPQNKPIQKPTTDVKPVVSPTYAPTFTAQNALVSVDVIFSGMAGKLDGKSQEIFKTVTGDFIYYSLQELDFNVDVKIVDVSIEIFSQVIETQGRRFLASETVKLRVRYNALIEYQSTLDDHDTVSEWVGKVFNTDDQRELYLKQLRKADEDTFDNAESAVVLVEGVAPPEVTPIDEKSTNKGFFSNENLWYVIGAVGGTISLIIIICTLYAIGRNKRRKSEITGKPNMTTMTKIKNQFSYDSDLSPTNKLHYTAEIDVDLQNDDVSTLGDPTYYGGAPDQATTAGGPILVPSTHGTSATQKLYHPSDPRERFLSEDDTDDNIRFSESNLSKQNDDDIVVHTVIDDSADHGDNDDQAADYAMNRFPVAKSNQMMTKSGGVTGSKYAVEVPPGKLGMIIDTPDNGPPVVHTIKPESILCATVQAGDYLISVDDEVVTHMTAVQVSKLISIKSDQQRTLVFLRKPMRNRINSSSSDYFVEQNGAC